MSSRDLAAPIALAPERLAVDPAIDDETVFQALFSANALVEAYAAKFSATTGKGVDRLNGFQFSGRAVGELGVAAQKCLTGQYRFSPYLEVLKTKGRGKAPRLISIPTVRDRVVLHQLNRYLAALYPDCVPKNVASSYVRAIATDLRQRPPATTWVCGTDIKAFYDSIQRDRVIKEIRKRIKCGAALRLIDRALQAPTVPKNTQRWRYKSFRLSKGVPQGLAVSNVLASIYLRDVDLAMRQQSVTYYRYVDDVLMYGGQAEVSHAFKSLRARLLHRGLSLHAIGQGKSHMARLSEPFGYLGYIFRLPEITVREATVERFLQSIAAKFSDYLHNKERRLKRWSYLDEARLAEIFLMELNERITGAISERKRYGWIAYFNEITDLSLLYRLDKAIAGMFKRLTDFHGAAPAALRKLSRSYFEMKYNVDGGYVRNYDVIKTRAEKLAFLVERGRLGPEEVLTDEQINARYESYLHRLLSEMHADEATLYG